MDRYAFPAVFEADNDGRGYTVRFPDLPGCITAWMDDGSCSR